MNSYYETSNANAHRGMHELAEKATVVYEDARKAVAKFIGAKTHEVIFTKSCTEAINLVSRCWGVHLRQGDTVLLSILEHHSNIVPWLQLKEWIGINVEWIGMQEDGSLNMGDLEKHLHSGTVKLVAITGLSNVLGTTTDLHTIVKHSHKAGAKVLVDAAQLIAHEEVDVLELDCDFLTFSGHKLYGPTGIGVLYAREELLNAMPPFLGGGSMVENVTTDGYTPTEIPHKFEAGSPPVAEAVGLHAAIEWLAQFDWEDIASHEQQLMAYATNTLKTIDGLHILGSPKVGCIAFTVDGVHPHDLTEVVGRQGVALRAGHHCAQPLHDALGVPATTRMSFGIYTTEKDIDLCIKQLALAVDRLR